VIRCKDCRFFTAGESYCEPNDGPFGSCGHEAFAYSDGVPGDAKRTDGLYYSDYEGYSAGFSVGEDFGCIHGEHADD